MSYGSPTPRRRSNIFRWLCIMTHLKCYVGEYGVIVNREGEFLILRLPQSDEFPTEMWMLPGGWLESDDQPEEGLFREVTEETGLEVDIVAPVHTARWGIEDPPKYSVFYLCRVIGGSDAVISSEHTESRWIDFDEIGSVPWHNMNSRLAAEKASKLRSCLARGVENT
jgi:8-oxo-dGTP diphosphatase